MVAVALAFLTGCGGDGMSAPEPEPGIPTEVTTPEELFASHVAAWGARDLTAYGALLSDGFTFRLRDDDVGQFPWAPDDSWDRAAEMGMMANLFDDGFAGGGSAAVQTVDLQGEIIAQRNTVDADSVAVTEVTADVVVILTTGPNEGFRVDTRLVVDLVEREGGILRIKRMQEVLVLEPARTDPPGDTETVPDRTSLGRTKAQFR